MLRIQKYDPPTLDRPSQWSKEFNAFIAACLKKDASKRAEAGELLQVGHDSARLAGLLGDGEGGGRVVDGMERTWLLQWNGSCPAAYWVCYESSRRSLNVVC